jgi:hypothetical protein
VIYRCSSNDARGFGAVCHVTLVFTQSNTTILYISVQSQDLFSGSRNQVVEEVGSFRNTPLTSDRFLVRQACDVGLRCSDIAR